MLGELDWRFNGAFTRLLKTQVLTGKKGEATYVPIFWNEMTFHFLVIGGGSVSNVKPSFELARKKMSELKLSNLGVSARDWNEALEEDPNLWILN